MHKSKITLKIKQMEYIDTASGWSNIWLICFNIGLHIIKHEKLEVDNYYNFIYSQTLK